MDQGKTDAEKDDDDGEEEEFNLPQREEEKVFSLNKCILAALILLGLGTIFFSGEYDAYEAPVFLLIGGSWRTHMNSDLKTKIFNMVRLHVLCYEESCDSRHCTYGVGHMREWI